MEVGTSFIFQVVMGIIFADRLTVFPISLFCFLTGDNGWNEITWSPPYLGCALLFGNHCCTGGGKTNFRVCRVVEEAHKEILPLITKDWTFKRLGNTIGETGNHAMNPLNVEKSLPETEGLHIEDWNLHLTHVSGAVYGRSATRLSLLFCVSP